MKVGTSKSTKPADIIDAVQNIRVTEANKSYMDHTFKLVADENGLAVKDVDANTQTSYVAWATFIDSSLSSIKDENGNDIPTNGGYPIINWGTENDGNGESEITFDAEATYHFKSPNSNLQIEFDFKLADYASLEEVKAALNGASLGPVSVNAPGTLSASGNTSVGRISGVYNSAIANSFSLQRDFGRDFDNQNAVLTGQISVERTTISGQPSVSDRPLSNGLYQNNAHTLTKVGSNSSTYVSSTVSSPHPIEYYYVEEDDGYGGTRTRYFKAELSDCEVNYKVEWNAKDTWTQEVNYTFSGNLNGQNLSGATKSQYETYERTLKLSQNRRDTFSEYSVNEIFDTSGISSTFVKKDMTYIRNLDGSRPGGVTSTFYGDVNVENVGSETMTGIQTGTFTNIAFSNATNKTPFSLNYSVSLGEARNLAGTSGTQELGSVRFDARSYASRNFRPAEFDQSISEAQFSNVKVNEVVLEIPPRRLIIQSGADSDDQIEMEWGPLNLGALGLYSTKTLTQEQALEAIDQSAKALQIISSTREKFGAYQNRFEHAIKMTDNTVENTTYAESMIRDTDMAKEMVRYSNANIIAQTGQAMLAQANQSKRGILSLISQ